MYFLRVVHSVCDKSPLLSIGALSITINILYVSFIQQKYSIYIAYIKYHINYQLYIFRVIKYHTSMVIT